MMRKKLVIFLSVVQLFFSNCTAQQRLADYIGEWKGKEANTGDLNIDITLEPKGENTVFKLSNSKEILTKTFKLENNIALTLADGLTFSGVMSKDKTTINGFIRLQQNLYPTRLRKKGNLYVGKWHLSVLRYLRSNDLRLTLKETNGDEFEAYPILGTFWCDDFKKEENAISFKDYKTGLTFKGHLKPSEILLDISIGKHLLTTVSYRKASNNKELNATLSKANPPVNDGWKISSDQLTLKKMEEDIQSDVLEGTEGVVIAKNSEIIYENYFDGFKATTPHDTRSASKSVSSAIIGIAIDDNIIEDVEQTIYTYLPNKYQYTKDEKKAKIRIKDLLTMSSGMYISEGQYQESDNWLKTVLEAPIKHTPGTYTDYQSADPFLLGIYLSSRLDVPLEFYMDNKLFAPLGITNYIINTDDTETTPYFGGGLHLTPRDMLKFGQLYLNEGSWQGKQIISKDWVKASFKKYTRLQDTRDKNEYGYLWWHKSYEVNGKTYNSIEARGAGGQYIFVIPALDTVMVITSGNYRNRKTSQPEKIAQEYILPVLLD
ncbi:MAG: serine hydrolase domain-containing protein [Thermonemataceae bacterium]